VATGAHRTTLNVEMYRADAQETKSPIIIKGVARDDKDNIYKLAF
jgi:hypothetical protein